MKHHYIPQFYLGKWKNSEGQVVCWTLKHNKLVHDYHPPAHTGYETDLYSKTSNTNEQDRHSIELNLYKLIDDKSAIILNKLLTKGISSLTDKEKTDWSQFIYSLQLRHPNRINNAKSISTVITSDNDHAIKTIAAMSDPTNEDVDYAKRFQNCMMNLHWWIKDFSGTNFDLITSDNPITVYTFVEGLEPYKSTISALQSGFFVLIFPLSPSKCFFASKSPALLNYTKSQLTRLVNLCTVSRAEKFLYTKNSSQQKFIEKHFKTCKPAKV